VSHDLVQNNITALLWVVFYPGVQFVYIVYADLNNSLVFDMKRKTFEELPISQFQKKELRIGRGLSDFEFNRIRNVFHTNDEYIDHLEKQNEILKDLNSNLFKDNEDMHKQNDHLEQENQKLKTLLDLAMGDEGLGFYGEDDNWSVTNSSQHCPYMINGDDIEHDGVRFLGGKRARATREEIFKQMEGM
jgi:hypothetical protein